MSVQLLDSADRVRRVVSPGIALKRKSALGQFMTPSPVARFMASLLPQARSLPALYSKSQLARSRAHLLIVGPREHCLFCKVGLNAYEAGLGPADYT